MATRRSAGILLYRVRAGDEVLEVLLGHMGGPFWARRDAGAWSIPKGEYAEDEDPYEVALREFEEEMGSPPQTSGLEPLGEVRQSGGKVVTAWYGPGTFDVATQRSNTFTLEWPPRSGRTQTHPEIDRAAWLPLPIARDKIVTSQTPLLDLLAAAFAHASPADAADPGPRGPLRVGDGARLSDDLAALRDDDWR